MFPDQIFQNKQAIVPEIQLEVLRHIDLGERVICAQCKANGIDAKRITQDVYEVQVNEIPVWKLQGRIVGDWFALILEEKYQAEMVGKTILILSDFV